MRTAQDIIARNRKQQRRERNDPNNLHYNQKKVENPVLNQQQADVLKGTPKKWVPQYD